MSSFSENRKAHFNYELLEELEAGIELFGHEVRAVRTGKMTLEGAHVSVRLVGDRATIAEGVLVRVSEDAALEMHIDSDEGNAAGVAAESTGQILIPMMAV